MDFAQLRANIFEAEDETPVSTPVRDQLRDSLVGFPLLLGAGSLILWGFDRFAQDGKLLSSEGEYNYQPFVFSVLGLFPFGFGLGGLFRGLQANRDMENYETLIEVAEAEMERLESEVLEAESEAAEEEAREKYGAESSGGMATFFMDSTSTPNANTQGIYGSAFGQQPVSVRSSFQRDTFGF
jgi:cell division protein FtsB